MRVAVMSDIHGFSLAFACVLADIKRHGPFDAVVVAGDLCETGPAPDEVLDRMRSNSIPSVQGNTDRDIALGARSSASARWTAERIGPSGIDFLRDLPFELRIKPTPNAPSEHDLLVVHANPVDQDRHLQPDMSEREIAPLINASPAAAIAFGHLHIPYTRRVGGRLLVDVAAVGNPKDGSLQCTWAIIDWDAGEATWRAEIRRVAYPVDATIDQLRKCGLPNAEKVIARLLRASY